ncbi:MAG: hypothetical protein H8E44_39625 [Planctomycetes bacterium]|nr:hypothetical protein [Planctomycetota bacterium]
MHQRKKLQTRARRCLGLLATIFAFAVGPLPGSADDDVDLQATGKEIPDTPKSISLQINSIPGIGTPSGYPITTGVPFANGQLSEAQLRRLRLFGPGGEPMPMQFDVRGRYLRSKDVRWLGVDFQLEPGVGDYRLEMTGGPGPSHPTPIRVDSTDDALVVTTGELKAEIPKVGAMLRRVWLAGELVLEQGPQDGNWLTTLDGQLHREVAEKAAIELNGPLHATIRVDGRYVDPEGDPSCKWTARLHFFAGQPAIQIDHRFTWIGKAEELKIRDLAISFGLKQPATEAAADGSDAPTGEPVERPLAQGQMLSLLQDEHRHWGHGNSHFGIYHGPLDKPKELAMGQRAGSWVGVSDGQRSVTLALRDLWQQFPKELRAEPSRLTAYLWATHERALPLDLTFDNLEKFWGEPMLAQLNGQGPNAEFYQRQRQRGDQVADPTGMAKSHDLLLVFGNGGAGWAGGRLAKVFDSPPLVRPDPKWTTQSNVVGRMWPRDPERFPELEKWIDRTWTELVTILDDWGDYGFFSYGDGPHQTYRFVDGRAIASPWRYTQSAEYGVHKAAWLAWLRGGHRQIYDYAVAHTRFFNDVYTSHEDTPTRWKGYGGSGTVPWIGVANPIIEPHGPQRVFGLFLDHALFHFYLTGDQRAMDAVRDQAHHWKPFLKQNPDWARQFVAQMNNSLSRWIFHRLDDFVTLAEALEDPYYSELAKALLDVLVDLDDSGGIVRELADRTGEKRNAYPTYIYYKGVNLVRYMRHFEGRDVDGAKRAFVKMAEHQFRTQNIEARTIGCRMAYAYYFTKEPRYLSFALRRLEVSRREQLARGPWGEREYAVIPSRAGAFNSIVNYAYLMPALAECPNPPDWRSVPMLTKEIHSPPLEFVFEKQAEGPLTIELSASRSATFTDSDGKPLPKAWLGDPITYWPHADAYADLNTDEPMLYRTVSVPADVPADEVRVRVGRDSTAYVFSSNASRAVMLAPEGFYAGNGALCVAGREVRIGAGDLWHFEVPTGAKRFRVATSRPDQLTIRDPNGRAAEFEPLGKDAFQVTVPADAAAGLWSVSASSTVAVALADIRPAFAYRDAKMFFMPEGVETIVRFPQAEATTQADQ